MASQYVGVWVILVAYMLLLVFLAFLARRRQAATNHNPLTTHYLAGKGMGPIVLLFSTLATVFSGYSVVGIPGEAFAQGWFALRWVGLMLTVGIVFSLVAPRMFWLSRKRDYVACLDFIHDRYGPGLATTFLAIVIIVCLFLPSFVYITSQFVAFASTVQGFFGSDSIPSFVASAFLACVLLIFEFVGGLNAVAFTDVVQGVVLGIGAALLFVFQATVFGGLPGIGERVSVAKPEHMATLQPRDTLEWYNLWTVQLGVPFFPHLMTRVLASRDAPSTRLANQGMMWSPFLVNLAGVVVGLIATDRHPGAVKAEVFGLVLADVLDHDAFSYVAGSLLLSASVAAVMSTTDSVLIALAHLLTADVFRPLLPGISGKSLMRIGTVCSVVVATSAALLAELKVDLSQLILLQNLILCQVAPAYLLGMYWVGAEPLPFAFGIVAGLGTGALLSWFEVTMAAAISLCVNVLVALVLHIVIPRSFVKCRGLTDDMIGLRPEAYTTGEGEPIFFPYVYALLFICWFFIPPFFRTPGEQDELWGGVPIWAAVSLLVSTGVAGVHLVFLQVAWTGPRSSSRSNGGVYSTFVDLDSAQ
eukprot:TRINITY_DN9008_c0_g1_i1.p1 TRINITY_DN9008_c0_g1~~TRINITY_DN9008_c0_g1_i1.p1  ORF type:complete len:587 (+),score=53.38 TRINITY_DN9008_c0_g1_i1:20-1780(+)